jgi:hypothetical protein
VKLHSADHRGDVLSAQLLGGITDNTNELVAERHLSA